MDRRGFLAASAFGLLSPRALAARLGGTPVVLVTADLESHVVALGLPNGRRLREIATLPGPRSIESVADAARSADPAFVVVSSVDARSFRRHAASLAGLARDYRLGLGGAGAAKARLDADVVTLGGGAVDEAERLTQLALG